MLDDPTPNNGSTTRAARMLNDAALLFCVVGYSLHWKALNYKNEMNRATFVYI